MGKNKKKKNKEPEQVISIRTVEDIFEENFKYFLYKKSSSEMSKDFEDLSGYNVHWWGVDRQGYIFNLWNLGSGAIPKVVVNNLAIQDLADFYFDNILEFSTKENIKLFPNDYYYDFVSKYEILLAQKGIFYFEAVIDYCDPRGHKIFVEHPYWYRKLVSPVKPIHIDSLDNRVQILMSYFRFDVDVKNNDYIFFKSLWDVL